MSKRRCSNCKEYFSESEMITISGSVQAFHSIECYKEKKYGKKPPSKKPKKDITSKIRKSVKQRDGNKCRMCHRAVATQVHHIVYRSEGGGHGLENLITLCGKCHETVHSDKKKYQARLLTMVGESTGDGKMQRHCVYHAGCVDGFTSAWLMRKVYPDIVLHEGRYGEDPPEVGENDVVYLTDFSYKREPMISLSKAAAQITVLDHHKSALDDLIQLPSNVHLYLDMDKCGSAITLDYLEWSEDFEASSDLREMISYIQDRDLWTRALPETDAINAYIQSLPFDFEQMDFLVDLFQTDLYSLIVSGKAILMRDNKVVAEILKTARPIVIGGHSVEVVASPYSYGSTVAGELAKDHEFGAYYVDGPDGRAFGLRSRDDGIDVSKIAETYGGGGHVHASGFKVLWGHKLALGE